MGDGKVLYGAHQGVHVLRYVGNIRYPLAPAVGSFVEQLLGGASRAPLIIDLTETETIDSTNLGLIARLANRVQEHGGARVTIASDREDVNEILNSMGFDEVFDIVPPLTCAPATQEVVTKGSSNPEALTRTVLEAHRALMDLNEHNRAQFRDVVAAIERSSTRKDAE